MVTFAYRLEQIRRLLRRRHIGACSSGLAVAGVVVRLEQVAVVLVALAVLRGPVGVQDPAVLRGLVVPSFGPILGL